MNGTIDIICPVYNGEKYILKLNDSIKKQKNVKINSVNYILTESEDNSENVFLKNNIKYTKIKKEEYSHSKTREKIAQKCNSDIIVCITQDIIIVDDYWLFNLVKPIIEGECSASYSRQISKSNGIEKYIRELNYPEISILKEKKDIKKLKLKTFFFSDVSSAIDNRVFKEINYYDNKNLKISEDMYLAYKLIINNYKVKYVSESKVIHSHNFSLKELYNRYYETGVFFKENKYLDKYSTNIAGVSMAKYILKRIIQERNFRAFLRFWPDMIVRFIAFKIAKFKKLKEEL